LHAAAVPGEVTMPKARRAVLLARATFDKNVGGFTREASDTKPPGRCRVIEGGIDEVYFARRLEDFEVFFDAMTECGARSIYWA
jgi:hypothetical protein